jgi:MFS family permease
VFRITLPIGTRIGERWRFRNRLPTNHPRTSYQTRVWGTRSQRWFFVDGLFASASDVIIVQFLSIYAIALGATNAEVGLLAIANGLAGILALTPGAWIAERTPSRKLVVLLAGGGAGRLAVLGMALTPILMREPHEGVYMLIALTFLRWFAGSSGHPSWVSLLADIIPIDLRRFYVSQRMLGITIVAAMMAPIAGWFIRIVGGIEGFQWAFFIAFGLGVLSTLAYSRIVEPSRPATIERPRGLTGAMLRDRLFVRYLASTFVLHTTTMIVGPFFAAYLVRNLSATTAEVGMLATVDQVAAVAAQLGLGLIVARYSTERMMRWLMLAMPFIPLLWLPATEPWHAILPHIVGGSTWAMYNVIAFNLMMDYAPSHNIPRYAATHQMTLLAASFVGPVIGTVIVATWGIRVAMIVSGLGRLLGGAILVLPVRTAAATPAAVTSAAPDPGEGGA